MLALYELESKYTHLMNTKSSSQDLVNFDSLFESSIQVRCATPACEAYPASRPISMRMGEHRYCLVPQPHFLTRNSSSASQIKLQRNVSYNVQSSHLAACEQANKSQGPSSEKDSDPEHLLGMKKNRGERWLAWLWLISSRFPCMDCLLGSYSIFWCHDFSRKVCSMHAMLRSSEDPPMARTPVENAKRAG